MKKIQYRCCFIIGLIISFNILNDKSENKTQTNILNNIKNGIYENTSYVSKKKTKRNGRLR